MCNCLYDKLLTNIIFTYITGGSFQKWLFWIITAFKKLFKNPQNTILMQLIIIRNTPKYKRKVLHSIRGTHSSEPRKFWGEIWPENKASDAKIYIKVRLCVSCRSVSKKWRNSVVFQENKPRLQNNQWIKRSDAIMLKNNCPLKVKNYPCKLFFGFWPYFTQNDMGSNSYDWKQKF